MECMKNSMKLGDNLDMILKDTVRKDQSRGHLGGISTLQKSEA